MGKHNRHIDNESLDQLLREFLLEENTTLLTEKDMDMNAAILFSAQPAVTLPAEQEKVLLNDLGNLLDSRRGKRGWWLFSFLLLLICAGAAFYFSRETDSRLSSSDESIPQASNTTPVIITDGGFDPGDENIRIVSDFVFGVSESDDSVPAGDSSGNEHNPLPNPGKSNPTRMYIPQDYGYEEYPFAAADPEFTAKPSPDNFKVSKVIFRIDTNGRNSVMFRNVQPSVTANYYEGEPFKSGMNDFQYVNFGEYAINSGGVTQLPWQVLCYADTNELDIMRYDWRDNTMAYLQLNTLPEKGVRLATEPFYFGKYEVTNSEYRQFIQWVRTSNGYGNKPVTKVTIDTIPVTDPKDNSGEQITIKGKRFRIQRKTEIIEDYNKVYRYIFINASDELLAELGSQSLIVYPDTLSWINDFMFSYNEPMTNMYFWHPAYDNYPVVGISWYQAIAFLDWKTAMHQKQLDKQEVPYLVEYSLPSDIEWELVTMLNKKDGKNAFDFTSGCSDGWMTNLGVKYSNDDAYDRPDYLKNLFTKDQYYRGDFIRDGFFHTGLARLAKNSETHVGPFDVCWLDGNVSEWMMESYAENWKPFFDKHMLALSVDKRESTQLAMQIEAFYNKGNAASGRLVRGANWYDERFGSRPGSTLNEAGISPRRYIDPREQHSTVGFRYVIRVRYKDEIQRLQ